MTRDRPTMAELKAMDESANKWHRQAERYEALLAEAALSVLDFRIVHGRVEFLSCRACGALGYHDRKDTASTCWVSAAFAEPGSSVRGRVEAFILRGVAEARRHREQTAREAPA